MKNIFRKVCVLSLAALASLGAVSPAANAAAPTGESMGVHYTDTVGIAPALYDFQPVLTLGSGLTFTGTALQLITEVTNAANIPEGATLYLRIADSLGAAPSDASDWVAYSNSDSLAESALKRVNTGTYHIYWYLDGDNNHADITGE